MYITFKNNFGRKKLSLSCQFSRPKEEYISAHQLELRVCPQCDIHEVADESHFFVCPKYKNERSEIMETVSNLNGALLRLATVIGA